MECFFRRPRCTFFLPRTSVCLFLFQIHSIIPDCSKHSRTFQEPHIPFSTPARITTLLPKTYTCPHSDFFFFLSIIPHHGWTRPKKRPPLYLFSPRWGIWVTLNEGRPSYFRHTWLAYCAAIQKKKTSESRHDPPAVDEAAPKAASLICLVWLDSWWDLMGVWNATAWLHRCRAYLTLSSLAHLWL